VEFEILDFFSLFLLSTTHGCPFSAISSTSLIPILPSCLFLTLSPPERAGVSHLPPLLFSRTWYRVIPYSWPGHTFFSHLPTHVLVVALTHFHHTYYLSTYLPIVPAAGTSARAETKQRAKGRKIKKIALAETYTPVRKVLAQKKVLWQGLGGHRCTSTSVWILDQR